MCCSARAGTRKTGDVKKLFFMSRANCLVMLLYSGMNYARVIFGIILLGLFVFNSAPSVSLAATSTSTTTPVTEPFLVDLKVGERHPDVVRLQQYLNTNDFALASSGPGSLGAETTYFGMRTRDAVMRFQAFYSAEILTPLGLTAPTGNFFAATRSWLNTLLTRVSSTTEAIVESEPVRKITRGGGSSRRSSSVTVSASGDGNVTVSPTGAVSVRSGQTQSFTVTANSGFTTSASVGGTCPVGSWAGSTYTTGVVTGDCTVSFSASAVVYVVSATFDSNVTIVPEEDQSVVSGKRQAYTLSPSSGRTVGTPTGTCPNGTWVHLTYVTGTISGDCTVEFTAVFPSALGATSISDDDHIYLRQENGVFQYSLDQSSWSAAGWPLSITNTGVGTLTVHFVSDITITTNNSYIIVQSDNITFTGDSGSLTSPTIITVENISKYLGFISNGTSVTAGYNNIDVRSIAAYNKFSSIENGAGWLGQRYYGNGASGNEFRECYITGDVSIDGGGVVGANAEGVTIDECYGTGAVNANGGGLVGRFANGVTVTDSYATGRINPSGAGIIGANATNVTVNNVFGTGSIGTGAGGIVGPSATSTVVTHAYTAGIGTGNGIFAGSSSDGATNYAEANNGNAGWSDARAASVLQVVGVLWLSRAVDDAYILSSFDASPYFVSTETVAKNATSSPVLGFYDNCTLLSVEDANPSSYPAFTIDSGTGVVSVDGTATSGTYDLVVNCNSLLGGYTTATFVVTVP